MAAVTTPYNKENYNSNSAPASQINGSTRVGAGHDGRTQVIPRASGDNATTPATASVTGDTPVFEAYKHN
jgi:hypothetical protein